MIDALPAFVAEVQDLQRAEEVTATQTALVGFSQGAIMALEAMRAQPASPAGRVVTIAGRFADLREIAPTHSTLHLLNGNSDRFRIATRSSPRTGCWRAAATSPPKY